MGLMSGTSLDGIDAALLHTDGEQVHAHGASVTIPYTSDFRNELHALLHGKGNETITRHTLTELHARAVEGLIDQSGIPRRDIALIGFHGQTIAHNPAKGITRQIGNAQWLANTLGIPTVADFRIADVRAGGQGAPLVPLYHAALAATLPKPLTVVNIGGVANLTHLQGEEIFACDCGPGGALMDDLARAHTDLPYDKDGEIAASGFVDKAALKAFQRAPYFQQAGTKSLDRNDFTLEMVSHLPLADAMATLCEMTAWGIARAISVQTTLPARVLVAGGGRHNPHLMRRIAALLIDITVAPVETVGWKGDVIEAEAFAYLAARSVRGLPLSLPTTTGVKAPTTGGVLFKPEN